MHRQTDWLVRFGSIKRLGIVRELINFCAVWNTSDRLSPLSWLPRDPWATLRVSLWQCRQFNKLLSYNGVAIKMIIHKKCCAGYCSGCSLRLIMRDGLEMVCVCVCVCVSVTCGSLLSTNAGPPPLAAKRVHYSRFWSWNRTAGLLVSCRGRKEEEVPPKKARAARWHDDGL